MGNVKKRLIVIKTCFFIGHHEAPESIFPRLLESVCRHIDEHSVEEFVVGQYGNFDRMAARAVCEAKKQHPHIRLILLLPYYNPNRPPLPDSFDGSFYPLNMETVPKRLAIVRANQYMLRHCDCLITYKKGNIGNTRKLVAFALKRSRLFIDNIAE